MAGSKTEYPAMLAALQPSQAVNVLNSRVKQIHKINEDVSDWLAERRRVEEAYVAGLQRLAARRYDSGSDLGVFQAPWQSIVAGTISLAEAHHNFSARIQADVEGPLKEQRRDLQSINSLQSNLASMAKDLEKAQRKAGGASGTAAQEWETQAPYVFEQLQGLDETRVNSMREALTQLQTHEIDCHERGKTSAESGLNALLNVDTPEEVSAFVARMSAEVPPPAPQVSELAGRPDTSGGRNRNRTSTAQSDREPYGLAPPNRRATMDDQRSEISGNSEDAPKEKKGRLSGLRRLGTVMSRRKDKEKLDDKGEKSKGKSRNPLRRNSSSMPQPIPEDDTPVPDLPTANQTRRTSLHDEQQPQRPPQQQQPPAAAISAAPPLIDTQLPVSNGAMASTANDGPDGLYDSSPKEPEPPTTNGQPASSASTVPQIGVRPPSTVLEASNTSSMLADIERAQQEANAQNAQDSENAFNLSIRDKPIQEESSDQQAAAMANVSNTLRASVVPPPARRSGTLRGRRDVRNTVFVPNLPEVQNQQPPESSPVPVTGPVAAAAPIVPPVAPASDDTTSPISSPQVGTITSPIIGTITSPIVPSENRAADAQSIRSAHSMASSLGPGAIKHPEMSAPGLNASIVETSSATFSGGTVSKAVVIGEMAMVHNGAVSGSAAPHIRLDNFPVLEKVAPNPAFVTPLPGKSGEYNVDLSQLARSSVAFKYQVHLSESQLASYSPLLLTPQHRTEPTQTSVILNYTLNPAFAPPLSGSGASLPVALQNAVVILTLEGAKATSCQSKPAGVFSREKSLIYWKLGDLALGANGGGGGKLLARFATESEAKGASVEARWELQGAGSGLGVSLINVAAGGADPFADAGASSTSLSSGVTKEVETLRRLMAGKYITSL